MISEVDDKCYSNGLKCLRLLFIGFCVKNINVYWLIGKVIGCWKRQIRQPIIFHLFYKHINFNCYYFCTHEAYWKSSWNFSSLLDLWDIYSLRSRDFQVLWGLVYKKTSHYRILWRCKSHWEGEGMALYSWEPWWRRVGLHFITSVRRTRQSLTYDTPSHLSN